MANSHPGSYCGQDAYNDMFVTEKGGDAMTKNVNILPIRLDNGSATPLPSGDISPTIRQGAGPNGTANIGVQLETAVRRLTPLECERLQGFPDNWTDIGEWTDSNGKLHKESTDSARYKAIGNSICTPFWKWMARRICAQYERDITMGSLFDGIGGFPLVFEQVGAKAIWASEIEEFPMAVTKRHFPEEEGDL